MTDKTLIMFVLITALVCLLVSGIHSQNFPYIRYRGVILRNNSYINIGNLGINDSIECVTDLDTCCSKSQGVAMRAWFLPNGTMLSRHRVQEIGAYKIVGNAQSLSLKLTDLTARDNPDLSGVYECSIDTTSRPWESVYVGLYYEPGTIDGDFSAIDGHSPPFTLTFTSTNLPSTIVNWYLDGQRLNDIATTTVLSDPLTSKYIHTATLTERKGGIYKCSVTAISDQSTRAQSFDNAYFTVHVGSPPSKVSVFQESPTTVHVFWDPPDPVSDTIGYQIYYTGPTNGSIPADDADFNNEIIMDLINGETYHISVAGKSKHLESEPVVAYHSPIVLVPGAPELTLTSATADSVSLSWTIPRGTVVEKYELTWTINNPQGTYTHSEFVLDTAERSYTITGLNSYHNTSIGITVTSFNEVGSSTSHQLLVHSDFLQSGSAMETTDICSGGLIGGSLGSFLIGLVVGIIAGATVFKNCRNRKNKTKAKPIASNPPVGRCVSGNTDSLMQHSSNFDPPIARNLAYRSAAQTITLNSANQDDVTYEYVS